MQPAHRPGYAPAVFNALWFNEDTARASAAGARIANAARSQYEIDGVPIARLRLCASQGEDGTRLRGCLKVYLPEPAGRFGMVFRLIGHPSGSRLRFLAFGVRHHPRNSHAPTVYQLAHQRLNG